jgi:GTPase SAR1 family protein
MPWLLIYGKKKSSKNHFQFADMNFIFLTELNSFFFFFFETFSFLNDLERLNPSKYTPTEEDALRCRKKTTGLVTFPIETEFNGKKYTIKLIDVGGQRNERKKWINSFEGVSALLYVASLSEYDQKMYEDDVTNRMSESLELFEDNVNNKFFHNRPVVLFLNKKDLFAEKIKKSDLSKTFPDYTGGTSFENGTEFVRQQYLDKNKGEPDRIYSFFTCATDKKQVKESFDEILKLVEAGKLAGN